MASRESVEQRLDRIERRLGLYDLLTTYGPWIDDAWQVDRRRAYVLNGQERARALLREGVAL